MEAMYPLLCNPDEHVLSTLGSLVLALLEGKTDLPISGVFGAGKTRSAAILVVGLLVFEPNLNLMILTKENVAAQAFAEHIEGLNMPQCITSKISRLVGYMELKKNRTKGTSLDVTCENRHEVLRQKRLLIGCGGGFQQECSQSYSPVAQWITEVALTLTDESQQYGNIEETSVIARTSRTCLNIWAGDHRQTPGGLKNTVECLLFRQKLLQRPLALRCGTAHPTPGSRSEGQHSKDPYCSIEIDNGKTYEEARKPPITVHNAVSALGKDYTKKNYPGAGRHAFWGQMEMVQKEKGVTRGGYVCKWCRGQEHRAGLFCNWFWTSPLSASTTDG